jgi:hypothetical protein
MTVKPLTLRAFSRKGPDRRQTTEQQAEVIRAGGIKAG